jgi:hypothetical protein
MGSARPAPGRVAGLSRQEGTTMANNVKQPGEWSELVTYTVAINQMRSARNIPDRVFEAARVCAFAFPSASVEHVAERVASYYGYTDTEARRVFVGAVESYLYQRRT